MTTLERFQRQATAGALVPVWRDCLLDADTPVSAFAKVRRDPFAFLLESAPAGGETWARYTFLGTEPRRAWRLHDRVVDEWTPELGWHGSAELADPLAALRSRLTEFTPADVPELGAFWSGAVGYFGYDVVRLLERLPNAPPRTLDVPDALLVFTRALVIVDNLKSQARVVVAVPIDAATAGDAVAVREAYEAAEYEIDTLIARLREPVVLPPLELDARAPAAEGTSTYARADFERDVERIREYIFAGDCFQALLSRRIDVARDFEGSALYRALRVLNPSPYMYHLVLDGMEIVGSSPELLVRVADGKVTVRPIAGTRPRGSTPDEDAAMTAELSADEKERAEHVMLVDLGRNDVGRLARYGSVRVTDFMTVERYSHVLHLVSQVEGEIAGDTSAIEAFRATFPAGTMTGAPKVRAMQIIDEMEPGRRGPYAGALGYIAAGDGRMDLAITIRTCVLAGERATVQAGAGIVADSNPAREWEETEAKARAMLTAITQARRATAGALAGGV
ncbi:MAG TPA: anthranilate synthase component I family protein [Gemmatimonadaceae bacterium]|nr:anthranilate synthase component I family protein [Gemmatimonadaceae bacterium]